MKRHLIPTLVAVAGSLLLTVPPQAAAQKNGPGFAPRFRTETSCRPVVSKLAGWGEAISPEGDCKFYVTKGELLISVPGSPRPHDLAAEIKTINAPRVLQTVQADFTVQVRVDGRFAPGGKSTLPGRTSYNGAGIVLMADPQNVITLARAVLQTSDQDATPYANFEMRSGGELVRMGNTGDHPLPGTGPVFLRLERRSQNVFGAVSVDGIKWDNLAAKKIPSGWPQELQVGVVAISTSHDEFNPKFSKLRLSK